MLLKSLATLGEKVASLFGERIDFGFGSVSSPKEKKEYYFLQDVLPYRHFEERTGLFCNEENIGFIFETMPLVGCTEEIQRELHSLFHSLLPEGSTLQVLLYADSDISDSLDQWVHTRQNSTPIIRELAHQRRAFWLKDLKENRSMIPPRNLRVLISYSENFFGSENFSGTLSPLDAKRIATLKLQLKGAFKTLGIPTWDWEPKDLLSFLENILTEKTFLEHKNPIRWNPLEALNAQSRFHGLALEVTKEGLVIENNKVIRSFGVTREPHIWALFAMTDLIGDQFQSLMQIPCAFLMSYTIKISSQESTKTRVQSREDWVELQARSKIGKKIPILRSQSAELDFVRKQISKGERFVQTLFNVFLISKSEYVLEDEQATLALFRSKEWEMKPERYLHLPLFLSALPLACGRGYFQDLCLMHRFKTTVTTEVANLLPIQGEWKGTKGQGILLMGRRGQVFKWDLFSNNTGNYNVCVVGRSGSGKSVFMQELLTSIVGQGGQVFVLDVGRSFEKTAKILGGTYIEFSTRSPLCINPFSKLPNLEASEMSDNLAMLKPIFSLMGSPLDGTNDLENAQIEKGIFEAWQKKGRSATITDVADWLGSQEDTISLNLSRKLYPYTKDGIYGRFFEGEANVNLDSALVVIELEELKERKDLQAVIVQMMILHITNRLYLGDRQTPSALILDEAWDMLRGQKTGEFIETAARRLRKYKGALVVGTQSVHDFYINPGAQAAFDNSDWLCMLSQKKESIEQLKGLGRLSTDTYMEQLLKSLRTEQGKYAEVMIRGPHGYAVGRLVLDPFSKILYSTKAEEFSAVQNLINQNVTLEEAIRIVAKRKAP